MKKESVPAKNPIRWQDALPSSYETLIAGFHAGLTVEEMLAHLKLPVAAPKEIKNVKIGSVSPEIFAHQDLMEFWQTPVETYDLCEHKEIFNALNDPDIIEVQKSIGYDMNVCHPTLETLVRVAQTQYIGFQIRMGELTTQNLHARLKKLQDPKTYQALRNSPFVVNNKLRAALPETPPYFDVTKKEFCVKGVKSAMEKAYFRTGSPSYKRGWKYLQKDGQGQTIYDYPLNDFATYADEMGVFAVNDMQRTSLKLSPSGEINASILEKNYQNVRNILTVGLLSGTLGVILHENGHSELTDTVLCPPSEKPKHLFPTFMSKGEIYHSGPQGSYLTAPVEIQIAVLPEYADKLSHEVYERYRETTDEEDKKNCLNYRIMIFESNLPSLFNKRRKECAQSGIIPKDDIMMHFLNKNKKDILRNQGAVQKQALDVAYNEFPDPDLEGKHKTTKLDPFAKIRSPVTIKALRDIIQESDKATNYSAKLHISPLKKTFSPS